MHDHNPYMQDCFPSHRRSALFRRQYILPLLIVTYMAFCATPSDAGTSIPFTVNLSDAVNVVTTGGTPRITLDVSGATRYATYTSGTGTNALIFTYDSSSGDIDLDGVTLTSPIEPNGGDIKDLSGNAANLTFTLPDTSNVKVNYPSLDMDLTSGTSGLYTVGTAQQTTFATFLTAASATYTRSSIGTYYDSSGLIQTQTSGNPRFDYDPVSHAAKGLLIEESRANSLKGSSQIGNAYWTVNNGAVTLNAATSPSGATDASSLSSADVRAASALSYSSTSSIALSIYVKANAGTVFQMSFDNAGAFPSGGVFATFNVSTGVVASQSGTTSTSIVSVGNGWYRCALTGTATATGAATPIFKRSASAPSGGFYIWGVQLESGKFPSSYIPTTTATVTRSADSLTIPTGTWYTQGEGISYSEFDTLYDSGTTIDTSTIFSFDDGTLNNRNSLFSNVSGNTGMYHYVSNGGSAESTIIGNTFTAGTVTKASVRLKTNDVAFYQNGASKGSDTTVTTPTTTQLIIGARKNSVVEKFLNGHIRKIRYYKVPGTNAQLQALTQ